MAVSLGGGGVLRLSDVLQGARRAHPLPPSPPLVQAVFDDAELADARAVREAGLAILGFKPAAAVGPHYTAGLARFVYPSEKALKGSTAAFVALHKTMVDEVGGRAAAARGFFLLASERRGCWGLVAATGTSSRSQPPLPPNCCAQGKVAIARLVVRAGHAPNLVALLPQEEEVTADGVQVWCPRTRRLQHAGSGCALLGSMGAAALPRHVRTAHPRTHPPGDAAGAARAAAAVAR